MEMAIQEYQRDVAIEASASPQEMAMRLADMKTKLTLVQKFFNEIMVQGQDYGVIPGTEKPTLLKPGAEKLCELYGYAPLVKHVEEQSDRETGFYRARVTMALVHRKTGMVIAEGVGEANTMEGRYRWRWVPEWKLPKNIDKDSVYSEERTNRKGTFKMFKLENDDPYTLWNTVLKMAKKRALIDATLSATRSSGLFTQDAEDLQDWIASGGDDVDLPRGTVTPPPAKQAPPRPANGNGTEKMTDAQGRKIWALCKEIGIPVEDLKSLLTSRYGVESSKDLTKKQASEIIEYLSGLAAQVEAPQVDVEDASTPA